MINLDTADRVEGITERIRNKDILFKFYHEFYSKFADCLKYCPSNGLALEIGSGFGFLKEIIPNVVTSDVIPYKIVDIVMDASNLPFDDSSLKSVFMLNTLHHIPDSTSLFNEIERCLKPDGRMLIIDQYNGWFSKIIYRHLHHEPYDPNATSWCFQPSGPLSGANGALCWIIFYRDRALFEQLYPTLKIIRNEKGHILNFKYLVSDIINSTL